jgi:Kef-type K+ transport system membrane component KefB
MDIAGWLVLAVAVALLSATAHSLVIIAILLPAYVAVMLWAVRPALRRWMKPSFTVTSRGFLLTALTMVSAWCTGQLGLHVFFGALLMGILTPRRQDGTADPHLMQWMNRAGTALLPVFFAVTGLSVDIGGLGGADWAIFAGVSVLAIAGKVGGGTLTAKASRLPNRFSLVVGVLLNTRGLTELIALTAGYQIGLLNRTLFTILVLMAVTTTAMTGPLLAVLGIAKPVPKLVAVETPAPEAEAA